jgi:hypothetical protein
LRSLADNRAALAGSILCSQITGHSRMNPQAPDRVTSLRFWFPSAYLQPSPLIIIPKAASLRFIPLQRFTRVPAVLGATPLRKRLTSFALATVDRNQSCVTGLILGGVPLLVPYSFGLVDPFVWLL